MEIKIKALKDDLEYLNDYIDDDVNEFAIPDSVTSHQFLFLLFWTKIFSDQTQDTNVGDKHCILTGGAGSGKSFTLKLLKKLLLMNVNRHPSWQTKAP